MGLKASQKITVKVPRGPGELELLRAALDAVTENNMVRMAELEAEGYEIPCCADCGELSLIEPSEHSHRERIVDIGGVEKVLATRSGTCAELAAYDAAKTNLRNAQGASPKYAACEVIENSRGPGRHHVVVLRSDGTVKDHAEIKQGDCGC